MFNTKLTKVEVLIYILHKFKHQRVYRVAIKLFLHILQFVILIPNDYCQLCIYKILNRKQVLS